MTIQHRLKQDLQQIKHRISNGESTCAIALDYQCSAGSIWIFCKDNNIIMKSRSNNYGKVLQLKKQIIALYQDDHSAYAISKALNISKTVILKYLYAWGYNTSKKRKLDPDKVCLKDRCDEVIVLHKQGLSQAAISKKLGFSQGQICTTLQHLGIEAHPKTKYDIDETFFQVVNTQEKAYVLGWMYSDGNVMPSGKIRIQIQEGDRHILEEIKLCMQYTGNLYDIPPPKKYSHRKPQTLLNIDRKVLADQLITLGCTPNKSMTLIFPDNNIVPNHLLPHFVRGYFDGDGSISNGGITIVGTLQFIHKLANRLPGGYTNIYQRYKDRKPEDSSHQLFIGRNADKVNFLNWIYKGSTMKLNRKYTQAQMLLNGV